MIRTVISIEILQRSAAQNSSSRLAGLLIWQKNKEEKEFHDSWFIIKRCGGGKGMISTIIYNYSWKSNKVQTAEKGPVGGGRGKLLHEVGSWSHNTAGLFVTASAQTGKTVDHVEEEKQHFATNHALPSPLKKQLIGLIKMVAEWMTDQRMRSRETSYPVFKNLFEKKMFLLFMSVNFLLNQSVCQTVIMCNISLSESAVLLFTNALEKNLLIFTLLNQSLNCKCSPFHDRQNKLISWSCSQ